MPYRAIDLTKVKTYPLPQRINRVSLDDLIKPDSVFHPMDNADLREVAERIIAARFAGRPLIWSMGAHVVKRGLSPLVIDLLERGVITHLASNGATTIHDFEIAMQGHTSEDVASSLADGSFGMAEETGAMMNTAIRQGASLGIGLGEALGRYISEHEEEFPYREYSIVYHAFRLGVPYTVHVAIGTDIIHQHPLADFSAIGWASGQDFKIFTAAVCGLEGGVFCNFGSAVIGPEVFLKALSIARNLGNPVKIFTTANFDLLALGDYRKPIGDDQIDYYYRPRKNIVNRPVMLGGRGFHIAGDHLVTIPNLYHQVLDRLKGNKLGLPGSSIGGKNASSFELAVEAPGSATILSRMVDSHLELAGSAADLVHAFRACVRCFSTGGTLFVAGNGGSMADAIHIGGELDKSFKLHRVIPGALRQRLAQNPDGDELATHLQQGLRTMVLGLNPALTSAIDNDTRLAHTGMAQELYALARPGDTFLGISTSGNATNIRYATEVARAVGTTVIGLVGKDGGWLAGNADIIIHAPVQETAEVQNYHVVLYHTLCEMLEAHFFGGEEY